MSYFFLDTSALMKRYFRETGSNWVQSITNPSYGYTLIVAEITLVEASAAIALKSRLYGAISRQQRDNLIDLILHHCDTEYRMIRIDRDILDIGVSLTQNHPLRGYDAVQLATALFINERYIAGGLTGVTLVTADKDMVTAALQEGIQVKNPMD